MIENMRPAVYLLKKHKKDLNKPFSVRDFETTVQKLRQEPFFKEDLIGGKISAETLYNKAMTGNGKDVYLTAGTVKAEYQKRKAEEAKQQKQMGKQMDEANIKKDQPGLAGPKVH